MYLKFIIKYVISTETELMKLIRPISRIQHSINFFSNWKNSSLNQVVFLFYYLISLLWSYLGWFEQSLDHRHPYHYRKRERDHYTRTRNILQQPFGADPNETAWKLHSNVEMIKQMNFTIHETTLIRIFIPVPRPNINSTIYYTN